MFKKSELTNAAKQIAYANSKLLDAIGLCEELGNNDIFNYILKVSMMEESEYIYVLTELAMRVKKYSNDGISGDSNTYASVLSDASNVFADIFGKIEELE